jgi:hypothetical protein
MEDRDGWSGRRQRITADDADADAAAKRIWRKSLASSAPLHEKVKKNPPGSTRPSARRFKSL